MLNEYYEKAIERNETGRELESPSLHKIKEENRAFHYIERSDEELIEDTLQKYIEELNSTENFFNYFNGYEDEETGEFINNQGELYSINWTLEDNLRENGIDALEYVGVRVLTGFGGPFTFIDTVKGTAGVHWGAKSKEAALEHETIERLDEYFEDVFEYRIKYR